MAQSAVECGMSVTLVELAWVAGFLEGEGCFSATKLKHPRIDAPQVQREPLERLASILGCGVIYERPAKGRAQRQYQWIAQGKNAVGVMMTVYTWMSPKRKAEIQRALVAWRSVKPHARYRTHCKFGHAYTYVETEKRRRCWPCHTEANRRYLARISA